MKGLGCMMALLLCSSPTKVGAETLESNDALGRWWQSIETQFDSFAESRKIVPPTPIKVRWRAREVLTKPLENDLLDLIAADLNLDGKSELVGLTSKELLVISQYRGLVGVRSRVALPAVPSSLGSRDTIGELTAKVVDGVMTIRARTSEQGVGGIYQFENDALVLKSEFLGYPVCEDGEIEAAPGRNYFAGATARWPEGAFALKPSVYTVQCVSTVDSDGYPSRYSSQVETNGSLHVLCTSDRGACQSETIEQAGAGYAHLITDADQDGSPEVVVTGAGAFGASDRVTVMSYGEDGLVSVFEKDFDAGVVALAAADLDGDGALEIIAALRVPGGGQVVLWLLN